MITNDDFIVQLQNHLFGVVKDNRGNEYYNIPAAFDIETTSVSLPISDKERRKLGFMYIWQLGIMNWVTYGRTWEEFENLIARIQEVLILHENRRLVVYVHNLGYEFQFIRKHFEWDNVFFIDRKHPVYCMTKGVEFRCSMKLSGKSLANAAKDLQKYKLEKQVGLLDYTKIRHSKTVLSQKELKYCEYDIRVLLHYIQEKIEQDGNITNIPLTNTGYVRRYTKKRCFEKYNDYRNLMRNLTVEKDEYEQLRRAFQGGFPHANAKSVGKIIINVGSADINSSYPASMTLEKFPMSRAFRVNYNMSKEEFDYYLINKCCLFDIEINGLLPKDVYDHPISVSKCWDIVGVVEDNGRVVAAKSLKTTLTEQDFFILTAFYEMDSFTIDNFKYYEKGYLPTRLVSAILDLYSDKTTLKDVEGEEVNYMIKKNMVNASYGMMVTSIVRDEIVYGDDHEITVEKPDLDIALEKYNKKGNRFLYYPWGVWTTAYARANLFSAILEFGSDHKYSDTDSEKGTNMEKHNGYFERYNKEVKEKIRLSSEHHKIPIEKFEPLTKKGKKKTIGVWEIEGQYDEFKTLGAKRYMWRKGDEYSLTVAGTNKKQSTEYMVKTFKDPMKAFKIGLQIPATHSGRLTLSYIDEQFEEIIVDYNGVECTVKELSYIHMEPGTFTMEISDNYAKFLRELMKGEETWDEHV